MSDIERWEQTPNVVLSEATPEDAGVIVHALVALIGRCIDMYGAIEDDRELEKARRIEEVLERIWAAEYDERYSVYATISQG